MHSSNDSQCKEIKKLIYGGVDAKTFLICFPNKIFLIKGIGHIGANSWTQKFTVIKRHVGKPKNSEKSIGNLYQPDAIADI